MTKAKIIEGKKIAEKKKEQLEKEIKLLLKNDEIIPSLSVILVGNNPASISYIKSKQKACEMIGIKFEITKLNENISEQTLLSHIKKLNEDNNIHGILVQLPLPKHINSKKVIETIIPKKDVDGFHPINIGKILTGQKSFVPCTPFGIIEMLKETKIPIIGKHVVVIGRSNIVGKPVGQLFLNEHATVTYCHSKTTNLKEIVSQGDIVVVSVGKPNFITSEYIKDKAIVIDVGINRLETGKLCGDVFFDDVIKKASYITPVPGGVGPMTVAMLLANTVLATKNIAQQTPKNTVTLI